MTDHTDLIDRLTQIARSDAHTLEIRMAVAAAKARIAQLEARNAEMLAALKAATGYMLNAKIDLETGAPKRTAICTIDGGLAMLRAAIANAKGE